MPSHQTWRLAGLREVHDVQMLWFSGWYDGPRTGVARYQGREYWFVMVVSDDGNGWHSESRVFVLYELTPAELATEWEGHRSFSATGVPGCMHEPRCPVDNSGSAPELAALYERWPPDDEDAYLDRPAIGWFTEPEIA